MGGQHALLINVVAMAINHVVGCLPTYDQVGILAPILLVSCAACRAFSGRLIHDVDHLSLRTAPSRKRGWMTMWGLWGSVAGMPSPRHRAVPGPWIEPRTALRLGWRIAFALGSVITLVIAAAQPSPDAIRRTTQQAALKRAGDASIASTRVLLLNVASSVSFYLLFVYVVSDPGMIVVSHRLNLNTKVMGLLLILYPISAADRRSSRPKTDVHPGLRLACTGSLARAQSAAEPRSLDDLARELGLVMAVAILAGAKNAANVELMPQAIRNTGLALAFNLAEG